MKNQFEKIEGEDCPRVEIAEYIDRKLKLRDELDLELHFAQCETCATELKAQEKVSTTLEILLEEEKETIKLPENFTKIVTAKAESNLDGVRSRKERSKGLFIFAILFAMIAFAIGLEGKTITFAFEKFADQFLAVGGFVTHLFYQLVLGVSVVFGSMSNNFVFSSTLTFLAIVITFVLAFLMLSRMIFLYNRT